jgi:hypothetical protein
MYVLEAVTSPKKRPAGELALQGATSAAFLSEQIADVMPALRTGASLQTYMWA